MRERRQRTNAGERVCTESEALFTALTQVDAVDVVWTRGAPRRTLCAQHRSLTDCYSNRSDTTHLPSTEKGWEFRSKSRIFSMPPKLSILLGGRESGLHVTHFPWSHTTPYPKRHLDRFNHFVGFTVVSNRQTHRPRYVCNNGSHPLIACMQCGLIIEALPETPQYDDLWQNSPNFIVLSKVWSYFRLLYFNPIMSDTYKKRIKLQVTWTDMLCLKICGIRFQ